MNQIFEVRGLLEQLGPLPQTSDHLITREQVEAIMEHNPRAILPVSGDCLEGAQVMDGGWACIDFTRRPAPPRYKSKDGDGGSDLCLCYATYPEQPGPAIMAKEYLGVWGPWQMVGTRYDLSKGTHRMNCCFMAEEILGVLIASWDPSGRLLWKRDPESFPEDLVTAPTIHGSNVGDPIPLTVEQADKIERRIKEKVQ